MKFVLIFLLSSLALFLFLYFYPAHIFESKVVGNESELMIDLSLKNILTHNELPEQLNVANIISIKPTVIGIMLMVICLLALPIMIAYRFTLKKKSDETNKQNN